MTTAILFLDIDGVLNSYDEKQLIRKAKQLFPEKQWEELTLEEELFVQSHSFNPLAVMNLSSLICRVEKVAKVQIVLSSNWRQRKNVKDLLKHHFFAPLIIDITGKSTSRGEEIRDWLLENGERQNVKSFAILDDEDDLISNHFPQNFIQVSKQKLLSASDIDRAYAILNTPFPFFQQLARTKTIIKLQNLWKFIHLFNQTKTNLLTHLVNFSK